MASGGTVAGQASCDDEWGHRDRDRFCEVREQTLPAVSALRVDGGTNGGISVEGWDGDEIRMQAKVWADAESEARAESIVAGIRVVVENGRIRAEGPDTGRRESWGVGYALMVPRSSDLDLETTNGGISVAQVTGETRFRATNGGVHLEGLAGDVRGRTTNGGLHVALAGAEWQGQGLDVRTTNGGVTLEIPERYSAELETGTTNGTIDVDFPVTVQGRIGRRINATLGAGGAPVKVVTTNGGVRVQQR
jgi:hypothetical protein